MWVVVGLGNPGARYCDTRHNLGFMLIDRLSGEANIKVNKAMCEALVGRGRWMGQDVILAKPQTFMNLSGRSVKSLLARFKAAVSELIVAHDDLDIELGRAKLVLKGNSGGQKGVNSIISILGRNDFARYKMGIGRPENQHIEVSDYVLKSFKPEDRETVDKVLDRTVESLKTVLRDGLVQAQNRYNRFAPAELVN